MTRICLITTGQPTTNPRLVKEADALAEAGYDVHVIASFWAKWAEELDKQLLETRRWTCSYVGGSPTNQRLTYLYTRGRHGLGNRLAKVWSQPTVLNDWALARVVPELIDEATRKQADLYIAHNLGALPAAAAASEKHHARLGFDAEDFHSGQVSNDEANRSIEKLERECLPYCDYVTASSPGIARAYAEKYQIELPQTILNVFPLNHRPTSFRQTELNAPLTLYWFSQTIGPGRGLDDVLKAICRLPNQNINLHLRGDWQLGFKSQLYQLAAKIGVAENQIHVHAPAAAQEMVRLASAYDVGLSLEQPVTTNRDLCMSNKVFTYLLAGNAVVLTNTRGHRAILDQIGPAAISYQAGDSGMLAQTLECWSNDRDSLDRARRSAWQSSEDRFNWDIEKLKLLSIVEGALASKRTGLSRQHVVSVQ